MRLLTPIPLSTLTGTPTPVLTSTPSEGKIAFVRDGDIWVINEDGSGEKQLTSDGRGITGVQIREDGNEAKWEWPYYEGPQWSPDGNSLIFYRQSRELVDKGNYNYPSPLYIWDQKSGQLNELTGGGAAVWSSESDEILYKSSVTGGGVYDRSFQVVSVRDKSKRKLMDYQVSGMCGGAGSAIVHFFDVERGGLNMGVGSTLVWLPEISEVVVSTNCNNGSLKIFDYTSSTIKFSFREDIAELSYSATNKLFVGVSKKDSDRLLFYDLSGNLSDSIQTASSVSSPVWSHDGKKVYFASINALWQYNFSDGSLKKITELAGLLAHLTCDNRGGVYFTNITDGGSDPQKYLSVWHVEGDGSGIKKFLDNAGQPAWGPR